MPVTTHAVLTEDRFEVLLHNSEFLIDELVSGDMPASDALSELVVEISLLLPEEQAERLRSVLVSRALSGEEPGLSERLVDEINLALVRGQVEDSYRRCGIDPSLEET
jgi:hypothetical protein